MAAHLSLGRASTECNVPFTSVHINDRDSVLLNAAHTRLTTLGAPVIKHGGEAHKVVRSVVEQLDPYALHFSLVDPFNLMLPFSIIQELATLKRMDLLIHVSAMDLQRNWGTYARTPESPLDEFAPGWRQQVDPAQSEESARLSYIRYWIDLLQQIGFDADLRFELITGSKSQPLYWLVLVAKHEIAMRFWKKAAQQGKTQEMFD